MITAIEKIKVRKADVSDADAICKVGRRSFYEAFAYLFRNKNELHEYLLLTYSPGKIAESIKKSNNSFFIACINNQVVGFAKLKRISPHKLFVDPKQTELQKIYVLKEFHGSGIAQALMNEVINEAKKVGTNFLWLDVHVSNGKARRFYEKNEFARIGDHSFIIGSQTFYYDVMALPII